MKNLLAFSLVIFGLSNAHACESALDGTWQSDSERTMSFNRDHAKLEKRQDDFLSALTGKMTLAFSNGEIHIRMPDVQVPIQGEIRPFAGFEERNLYRVLFCNERMVVIEAPEAVTGEPGVTTYFFVDRDLMWVYSGTNSPKIPDLHLREYFRRVR